MDYPLNHPYPSPDFSSFSSPYLSQICENLRMTLTAGPRVRAWRADLLAIQDHGDTFRRHDPEAISAAQL
jgi:hypothetical protein